MFHKQDILQKKKRFYCKQFFHW